MIWILIIMGRCTLSLAGHGDKQERCQHPNPIYPKESVGRTMTCWGEPFTARGSHPPTLQRCMFQKPWKQRWNRLRIWFQQEQCPGLIFYKLIIYDFINHKSSFTTAIIICFYILGNEYEKMYTFSRKRILFISGLNFKENEHWEKHQLLLAFWNRDNLHLPTFPFNS